MIHVECASCAAPYQIDERRVPPSGLKMRCPKCGHAFVVPAPLPSDFPAALGFLDEADLPVVSPDLPAAKGASRAAAPATLGELAPDLPVTAAGLPARAKAPLRASELPTPALGVNLLARTNRGRQEAVDLPELAAGLPDPSAALPALAGATASTSTPSLAPRSMATMRATMRETGSPGDGNGPSDPARERAFGEIDLPVVTDSLPVPTALDRHLPVSAEPPELQLGGAFGEIDLPRESDLARGSPFPLARESADFGDLKLGDAHRRTAPLGSPRPSLPLSTEARASYGAEARASYGEVDFGGEPTASSGHGAISIDRVATPVVPSGAQRGALAISVPPGPTAAATVQARAPLRERPRTRKKRSLLVPALALGAIVAVVGGASLQLTPAGAFGTLAISDLLHSGDYALATTTAIVEAHKGFAPDSYDAGRTALDALYAAHARAPRARSLTAYVALADFGLTLRFGADASRASRARQLLAELPGDSSPRGKEAALAAQSAEAGEYDKARAKLEALAHSPEDAARLDIALLLGEVALAQQDGASALAAFQQATQLAPDARGHFGQARAFDLLGDSASARKEVDATLAASPAHSGALTLRARLRRTPDGATASLADLAAVLDGASRAKASPAELSNAYAARAWIDLRRGDTSEAREAFAQAVRLYPSNVDALNGEGKMLLDDGRFAEALARFDTALKVAPNSPDTIASDADAKIALERLSDAKQQLLAARDKYPKSTAVLVVLAKAERHLGSGDAAEADLRTAIAGIDPARPDAVAPFVALSELLASRGRLAQARGALDDAKSKLPASPALERAFGEVSELEGDEDAAIAHYRAAADRAPKDVRVVFRLAVALRRVRKFDAASAELDKVAALDPEYPGLLLERGVLFEESGQVDKAIEKFKEALSRAPDDPDLQLRVGSAYVAISRPDEALPMLRKVLEKRPTSAEAHHYIGRALLEKGGPLQTEALRYLQRAVDLDPNRAEFHVFVAWAANEAMPAQLELARDEIERALSLDKSNPEVYWQRGILERMEGAIDDAMRDERRALELRPSRYEAHATLAECYEDRNDETNARSEWAKALAGEPSAPLADGLLPHPFWRYRYGKLLLEKGAVPAAVTQLVPAVEAGEATDPRPGYLAPLEFLTADALRRAGRPSEAVDHYRRFMEIAPVTSPDRGDAQTALARLTSR